MESSESQKKILDVGCGMRKLPGAIGIDKNPRSAADVIHDLDQIPYPFAENSFDEILCDNVLEHVDDVIKVMEELHRIAKPDAMITVVAPFYAHRNANTDPTHRHFFGVHSFDYLVPGTDNASFQYSASRFEIVSIEFERNLIQRYWFDRFIVRFANRHKDLYENRLAYIVPLRNLTYTLRVRK